MMINSDVCICCENSDWRLIKNTDGGDYLKCKHCGYYIQSTSSSQPKEVLFIKEQHKFYDEDTVCLSPLFLSLQEITTSKRIKTIGKYLSSGKLLEVGPGSGDVLTRLLRLGYDVEAIEHSEVLAKNVRDNLGVKVKVGSFEDIDIDCGSYDAYMSFHVIEHVTDVISHLKKASAIVKDGGYALIATPHAGSWEQKLPLALSPNYSTAHFQLFSIDSLTYCLENTGWKIVEVATPSYVSSWLRVLTAIIRRLKGSGKSAPRGEYIKTSSSGVGWAVKLFSAITLPARRVQERMKYGNELFIVAQRQDRMASSERNTS